MSKENMLFLLINIAAGGILQVYLMPFCFKLLPQQSINWSTDSLWLDDLDNNLLMLNTIRYV